MTEKQEIINRLKQNLAEIITPEEFDALVARIEAGESVTHYIGFEISGYVHLGTGLMTALVIKDLVELGVKPIIWLADWHTVINGKLDGTFETAQRIGRGYFAEAMRASLRAIGADDTKVKFLLASEEYFKVGKSEELAHVPYHYWETVVKVAQNTSLSRMQRSISILGRSAGDDVDSATLLYPAMQVADIFFLDVDIAHAGMDQRKAHVVMRDTANAVHPKPEGRKPIAIHHPLLNGLQKPAEWPIPEGKDEKDVILEMKMSKSKQGSAIWVHDSEEEITKKIMGAFCPEKEVKYNPILNWAKHILFWSRTAPFIIERKDEHGGTVSFNSYKELEDTFAAGDVHPMDLKATVAKELIALLKPAREHFAQPEIAAMKQELDDVIAKRG